MLGREMSLWLRVSSHWKRGYNLNIWIICFWNFPFNNLGMVDFAEVWASGTPLSNNNSLINSNVHCKPLLFVWYSNGDFSHTINLRHLLNQESYFYRLKWTELRNLALLTWVLRDVTRIKTCQSFLGFKSNSNIAFTLCIRSVKTALRNGVPYIYVRKEFRR